MDSMYSPAHLLLAPMAYLLGSIPFGLIFSRLFSGKDVRKTGSGNIGATNVGRTAGILPGILTLVADAAKGAFPVWISLAAGSGKEAGNELLIGIVALAAFIGHLYPCFLKFKGGKGVATAGGCFLFISPMALLAAVVTFALAVFLTRRVSVGSLAGALVLAPAVAVIEHSGISAVFAGLIAMFIFIRHRENIQRIIDGKEPVFSVDDQKINHK
ncbi:MAG: glycerol-3-phosphate 1-O-acyltransferase PlsY [Desulfobacterales bacterium]